MNIQPLLPGVAVPAYAPGEQRKHKDQHEPARPGAAPDVVSLSSAAGASVAEQHPGATAQHLGQRLDANRVTTLAQARLRLHLGQEATVPLQQPTGLDLRGRIGQVPADLASLADAHLPDTYRTERIGTALADAAVAFEAAAVEAAERHALPQNAAALTESLQSAFRTLSSDVANTLIAATREKAYDEAAVSGQDTSPASVLLASPAADEQSREFLPAEVPSKLAVFMNELASTFANAMDELAGLTRFGDQLKSGSDRTEEAYSKPASEYSRAKSGALSSAKEHVNLQA